MTTTPAITSTNPLQVTVSTDQHMIEIKDNLTVTVGSDVVEIPIDVKQILHPVSVSSSTGHQYTTVSDDEGAPESTVVLGW